MRNESKQERQRNLALGVQRARKAGDTGSERALLAELLLELAPLIEHVAWRWLPSAGTLQIEDLRQVVRLSVVNGINAYDARGQLAPHIHARTNRDLGRYVLQQRSDVHVSVDASQQTARVKNTCTDAVSVESRDARAADVSRVFDHEVDDSNAETLYLAEEGKAQLHDAIRGLPSQLQRDLVRSHFGIGCEPVSVRVLHEQLGISRARATALLEEAMVLLRKRMK